MKINNVFLFNKYYLSSGVIEGKKTFPFPSDVYCSAAAPLSLQPNQVLEMLWAIASITWDPRRQYSWMSSHTQLPRASLDQIRLQAKQWRSGTGKAAHQGGWGKGLLQTPDLHMGHVLIVCYKNVIKLFPTWSTVLDIESTICPIQPISIVNILHSHLPIHLYLIFKKPYQIIRA